METRRLGRIDHEATILTLGGCGLGRLSQAEADAAIARAVHHGVNMIDVAPTYGEAEVRLQPWVTKDRDRFFIAEKTRQRGREGAWNELNRSLRRLGTEYVDLYQFHGIGSLRELDQIFDSTGAMAAFQEAQKSGLIKHIGITGHEDIGLLIKAIERYDFDTVLAPINVASMTNPQLVNDFRPLLEIAQEHDMGVIAIKALAKHRWSGDRTYRTWYQPVNTRSEVQLAIDFTLSQGGVTTYSLPCDVNLWNLVLDAAECYQPRTASEQETMIDYARAQSFKPLFPGSWPPQ